LIFGSGKDVTIKNIYGYSLGHSVIYFTSGDEFTKNLNVDGVRCGNLGNSCIRLDTIDGGKIKNVYSEMDYNKQFVTDYGVELWTGDSEGYFSRNLYFENITVIAPNIGGIALYSKSNNIYGAWNIYNISFKNVLIDCKLHCGGSYDPPGGITVNNANNVVFDTVIIRNTRLGLSGMRIENTRNVLNTINIKNSQFINNGQYGILGIGNVDWKVNYNTFFNNKLGAVNNVVLGEGNIFDNITPTPTIVPTPTVVPTIIPTVVPSIIPTVIPTIKPTPLPTNIIKNGEFESGKDFWIFYTNGIGPFNTISAFAVINLKNVNSNTQLYQTGISLESGTRYKLTFDAYSTFGHDVNIKLLKHTTPYTNYGINKNFDLNTTIKTFTYEFTSTVTVNDGRLLFWFVGMNTISGEKYYIDNISIRKIINKTPKRYI
jgi:hypothetical protein